VEICIAREESIKAVIAVIRKTYKKTWMLCRKSARNGSLYFGKIWGNILDYLTKYQDVKQGVL
jgi:hypothetical protein